MDAAMNYPRNPAMDKLHPEHASWMHRREQALCHTLAGAARKERWAIHNARRYDLSDRGMIVGAGG
jgi:hypothetical protein